MGGECLSEGRGHDPFICRADGGVPGGAVRALVTGAGAGGAVCRRGDAPAYGLTMAEVPGNKRQGWKKERVSPMQSENGTVQEPGYAERFLKLIF